MRKEDCPVCEGDRIVWQCAVTSRGVANWAHREITLCPACCDLKLREEAT